MTVKIIAEIGSVHDGSFGNAIKLIDESKRSGADFVKFQYHIAEHESLKSAPSPSYFSEESRFDYFKRTSFSLSQWYKLKEYAKKIKIGFMVSPFCIRAIQNLERINCQNYKVASGEITNLPLLKKLVKTKKRIFLSTGMSNWEEIDRAVKILKSSKDLIIFQCSSLYPCPPEYAGLNNIELMKSKYNLKVGFSDHTQGHVAALLSVMFGAKFIEKHVTFSKSMYGSDAKNASTFDELNSLVNDIKYLGKLINNNVNKNDLSLYKEMRKIFFKSIVTKRRLKTGDIIKPSDLTLKKPGNGISAEKIQNIVGKKVKVDIEKDTILKREHYEKN